MALVPIRMVIDRYLTLLSVNTDENVGATKCFQTRFLLEHQATVSYVLESVLVMRTVKPTMMAIVNRLNRFEQLLMLATF